MISASDLPDIVSVFPLPGALMLPRTRMPLHAEIFRERSERDRLARAGRAGDEAVPAGHLGEEIEFRGSLGDEEGIGGHDG